MSHGNGDGLRYPAIAMDPDVDFEEVRWEIAAHLGHEFVEFGRWMSAKPTCSCGAKLRDEEGYWLHTVKVAMWRLSDDRHIHRAAVPVAIHLLESGDAPGRWADLRNIAEGIAVPAG